MSNINIKIDNNIIVVTVDNKYCGTSVIPYEYNNEPASAFVNLICNCITKAIEDAEEKMWPKNGDTYYWPRPDRKFMYSYNPWHAYDCDMLLEKRGLVFKTKEEAIEAAKKMLEVIK